MTTLHALLLAVSVSLALSVALSLVMYKPLQSLLAKVCPGEEAVMFWARFSLTMMFLSPLLVSLVFGLPNRGTAQLGQSVLLIQSILTTSLFGSFLTMLGMGIWVSALIRGAPLEPVPRRSTGM